MKKIALCLHDLRVSESKETIRMISAVINRFKAPLTVHLVVDKPLQHEVDLYKFIADNIKNDRLEIVFHGLTHSCAVKTGKLYSFYHKYQAEYLVDSGQHRLESSETFNNLKQLLNTNIGICPPCWLSHKNNYRLFQKLNPLYIESMLSVNFISEKIFSPIMSIGSPVKREISFLKWGFNFMFLLSELLPSARSRIAVHVCDIDIEDTMIFFHTKFERLKSRGFKSVLQKELL
jgi:hypothetical protein